jgi:hypothetical protein
MGRKSASRQEGGKTRKRKPPRGGQARAAVEMQASVLEEAAL